MKNTIKQQHEQKLTTAQTITFIMGFAIMFYSLYQASTMSINNPLKEGYLVVLLFSMLVTGFSTFSIYSNNNK